jgi:hypothetical protein
MVDFRTEVNKMRKILCLTLTVCLVFLLTACAGVARFASVRVGKNEKFTKDEIKAAVQVVRDSAFESTFVTRIVYDETRSDEVIRSYLETGKGSFNGVSADDVIVLFTDFVTGGDTGALNPHDVYTGYNWILIRDGEGGAWVVDDCGY